MFGWVDDESNLAGNHSSCNFNKTLKGKNREKFELERIKIDLKLSSLR